MKHEQTEKDGILPLARKTAVSASRTIAKTCLATIDWYHRTSLHAKPGERTIAPTKRITFSEDLRHRVSANQGHQCMYCGVALLRLNKNRRHTDHKVPVEHGGSNEESNLQATCNSCNSRKGIQTDEEFRERYRDLLGNTQTGRPPTQRIDQERFNAVTKRTRQLDSTVARRKAIFKTPAQKISAASGVASVVLAIVWFFTIPLTFAESPAAGFVAFFGAPVVFALTWLGSMWRARTTGILNDGQGKKPSRDQPTA